ncbi:MAG: hypothetical protein K2M43_02090 [Mycoplasmoidaceae bacterium]|nr:hypothetical protein [Mycoplasmoidaceae bacterium]
MKRDITKPFRKPFNYSNDLSEDINKIIEENKDKSIAELRTLYLNLKLQVDSKTIELTQDHINYLTALKFLIEKKSSRREFLKTLIVAIITPLFSILISLAISLLIKS